MDLEAYISFPELEGGISEPIGKKLTIGSEIGELVLEDESISPRHCTFIQNQNIVSLIDHSSIGGTYLNKKKLEPARTFIVSEKDKIRIGNITAKLEYKELPTSASTFIMEGEELGENDLIHEEYTDVVSKLPSLESLKPEENILDDIMENELDMNLAEESVSVNISRLLENPKTNLENYFEDENALPAEDKTNINTVDVERVELDPEVLKYLSQSSQRKGLALAPGKRQRQAKENNSTLAKNSKTKAKKINRFYDSSAHIFFRFFGFSFDILICLSIMNIFLVYVDFKNFILSLGEMYLENIYVPFLKVYWEMLGFFIPMIKGVSSDIVAYEHFSLILAFIFFVFLFRLVSTFLFGCSAGYALIGIRSNGNDLIKRFTGVLREILGLLLAPFVIFDLPLFFSKRSFKEVITRTQLYIPSKASSILLTIFFTPVMIGLYCFSPMFKGLETLPQLKIDENITKPKPWGYEDKLHSKLLGMSYDSSRELLSLPSFKVKVKNNKTYLTFGIVFIDLKKGRTLEIRKMKDFSMQPIYKGFTDENYLSQYFWPAIHALVHDVALKNDNFNLKERLSEDVIDETKKIIKSIYSLEFKKIPEFIIANGPVMAGHRDFREKLESLYPLPPTSIHLNYFGHLFGVLSSHSDGVKQTYSFIPLESIHSGLYVFSADVLDPKMSLFVQHFKIEKNDNSKQLITEDPISKIASGFKKDPAFESFELSQILYERYFYLAQEFLKKDDSVLEEFLVQNLNGMLSILGENKNSNKKLFLNLTELLESLKKKDSKFFNINTVRTVNL